MNVDDGNELAKACGFADASEMNRLIARLDLSKSLVRFAFERWRTKDGTKNGLLGIYRMAGQSITAAQAEPLTDTDESARAGTFTAPLASE